MKNNNLILVAVAVVAIVLVALFGTEERKTEFEAAAIFPELKAQVTDVSVVKIENTAGIVIEAKSENGKWGAQNKSGYPLLMSEVAELLNSVASANLDEMKTSQAKNHGRLGLNDISDSENGATLLTLESANNEWRLLVGNNATSGAGTYIRLPQQEQTWLSKTLIRLPSSDLDWLQKEILGIDEDEVASLSSVKDNSWSISAEVEPELDAAIDVTPDLEAAPEANKQISWALVNKPADRNLRYESVLQSTVKDLLSLRFVELTSKSDFVMDNAAIEFELALMLRSGETISVTGLKVEEATFISFTSDQTDRLWNHWIYEVSSFNYGQLNKTMDDFLEEIVVEEEAPQLESLESAIDTP